MFSTQWFQYSLRELNGAVFDNLDQVRRNADTDFLAGNTDELATN